MCLFLSHTNTHLLLIDPPLQWDSKTPPQPVRIDFPLPGWGAWLCKRPTERLGRRESAGPRPAVWSLTAQAGTPAGAQKQGMGHPTSSLRDGVGISVNSTLQKQNVP